jgi:hypothetical protein
MLGEFYPFTLINFISVKNQFYGKKAADRAASSYLKYVFD